MESKPRAPSTAGVSRYRGTVVRFLLLFASVLAAYFAVTVSVRTRDPAKLESRPILATIARVHAAVNHHVILPYHAAIAAATAGSLRLLGYEVTASGRRILHARCSLEITHGCDGVEPWLLLASAMLVFPAAGPKKAVGLALSLVAIATCNYFRVVTLWLIGRHERSLFEFAHFSLFPFLVLGFALVVFTCWIRYANPARATGDRANP